MVRCSSCHTRNPAGGRFCTECGAPLPKTSLVLIACPACSFSNAPSVKFCAGCGKSVAVAGLAAEALPATAARGEDAAAERRQLTVMFCDLVGSTALSTALDPEEHREIIRSYQKTCAQVIAGYNGYIAQYLGDGIMVYFGYPQAHEDDAERAVHAGLGIIEAITALKPRHDLTLQVRIGIATGLVIVGDVIGKGTAWEIAVVGETPNLAARIQGLAQPNTVVIAPATRHLLGTQFDYEDMGQYTLKGFAQPVQAWRVIAERFVESRFTAGRAAGLTPLVDRVEQLGLLKNRGGGVLSGAGQIVLLGGEPGIGKSRLARALVDWMCEEHAASLMEFQCSPYHTQSALFPVAESLQRLIFVGSRPKDGAVRWAGLKAYLDTTGLDKLDNALPLFANLLSIPMPAEYPPLTLTRPRQRRLTRQYLLSLILQRAQGKPIVLLVEDLHWADPSTLELLDFFVEQSVREPLVGLFTYRPEFHPMWASRAHVTNLPIDRLQGNDASELVRQAARGEDLAPEIIKTVVAKTDGNPLYLEEFTKTVVESRQSATLSTVTVPASLHDLLLARLDRLGESKNLAQLMAMLGREFSVDLLRAVWVGGEKQLHSHMQRIVDAEVIYALGQERYQFKHALIQDAAYHSLLKSTRVAQHRRIAEVIEQQFADVVSAEPERVAKHYAAGKCPDKAIAFWLRAGQQTLRRNAPQEAISHLRNGLALLEELPDTPERARKELDLQMALVPALVAAKGYAALDIETACNRILLLCDPTRDMQQKFSALFWLWTFNAGRAHHRKGLGIAIELLQVAELTQNQDLLLEAHLINGLAYYFLGEYHKSLGHQAKSLSMYDEQRHGDHIFKFGQDPGVIDAAYLSILHWFLGDPDKSLSYSEQALALARRRKHPFSLSFAMTYRLYLDLLFRRDRSAETMALKQELQQLCTEHDIRNWLPHLSMFDGWLACETGNPKAGITHIQAAIDKCHAAEFLINLPYWNGLLAMACVEAGEMTKAMDILAQAFAHMEQTDERAAEPELHRFRGTLFDRQSSEVATVERCYRQALDTANRQGAKGWALRAATSLAEYLGRHDRRGEACKVLQEVLRGYPPDVKSRDLDDARALFGSLSADYAHVKQGQIMQA
jgi:predicted ATPase/class 3 adenylate cyclase